jgi:hypothetical protein
MRFVASVVLLLTLLCSAAHAADEMELSIDRHGIKVWTYRISGFPLLGFKATTTVKSTLGGLVNLITDTQAAPDWAYRINRIDVIKRDEAAQTFVIRVETNFWPLKDRDVYIQGRVVQDPQTLAVTIESQGTAPGVYPERSDFVRMPDMQGKWELRPLGNGQVEVSMYGRADPGGAIPKFLINMFVQEMPYNTMLGLEKVIVQDRYQKVLMKQIKEPGQ